VPGLTRNNLTDVDVTGDRHEAIAERLLGDASHTSGRFFAWFHFMDPHDEYREHPDVPAYGRPERDRGGSQERRGRAPTLRDRYDAEVTWTDRWVGRLVEFIQRQPWASRTAIIVSADHGEAFGEHGHYRHGFELWQELVRVPLFFVLPGVAPRRIATNRGHLDLAPTILELLGVAPAADLPGQSLVAELRGGAAPERDVWVDLPRTSDNDRRRALIHGRYKVLAYGDDSRFEVYDLETDPGEAHDLRATDRARYDEMVARYRAAQSSFHEVHPYQARNLRGAPAGRGW
jgi:choline-sulfatase